jgi:allantoate deiminase
VNAAQLGGRAEAMLTALGAISDDPGRLTRLFLSPAHGEAVHLVRDWMIAAGLAARIDALGTVHGIRPAGISGPSASKRLFLGSHIDTVVDAGIYDGALGVVAAILAVEELRARDVALPFATEVLAFGDEEGVRFARTMTSSQAIAGTLEADALEAVDRNGTTLRAAITAFGGDLAGIAAEAMSREDVLGYLEVHIEQGPVLDGAGEPLGIVSAIAGQGRYRVKVTGEAGHAGTVPMGMRRDALAAAAEMISAVEKAVMRAGEASLLATVGQVTVHPGASNVIPGNAEFSLDIRAADDRTRHLTSSAIQMAVESIGSRRGTAVQFEAVHGKPVTPMSPRLRRAIAGAIAQVTGKQPRELMSGAGHDAQAMARLTDVGMIFVRCRGGISHNPQEYASPADIGLAVEALVRTIEHLARDDLHQD